MNNIDDDADAEKPKNRESLKETMGFVEQVFAFAAAVISFITAFGVWIGPGVGLGVGFAMTLGVGAIVVVTINNSNSPQMTATPLIATPVPASTSTDVPPMPPMELSPSWTAIPSLTQTVAPPSPTDALTLTQTPAITTLNITATVSPPSSPQYGFVTVKVEVARLRTSNCTVIAQANRNDVLPIIARNNTNPIWYLIEASDGLELWISSEVVNLTAGPDEIPIASSNAIAGTCPTAIPRPSATSIPAPIPARPPEISSSWTGNSCPTFSAGVNWSDPDGDISHIIVAWGPDINNSNDGAEGERYYVDSSSTSGSWQSVVHLECINVSGDGCNVRFQAVDKQGNTSIFSRAYNTCP